MEITAVVYWKLNAWKIDCVDFQAPNDKVITISVAIQDKTVAHVGRNWQST